MFEAYSVMLWMELLHDERKQRVFVLTVLSLSF
jgi:hypothetical protein